MLVYVKFMKDLLSGKCKLKYDENITLAEELNAIIQLKHPPRLTDSAYRYITYSYGVLKDVLVRVENLLFPADFVILDIPEDSETPLLQGRPLFATCIALIDLEMGELVLIFNKEQVLFNVFEAMKHKKENLQHYKVDVVENIVEEVSPSESHFLPIEYIMANSINMIEEIQDKEVKEYVHVISKSETE
ncbi:uncharacterized protein LOC127138087 [Lathyrus oleraceus]|uniref:uncharacterized protein LOC127138087 n=1 Tax=Pisum sativum TaxID=3888 RepID=UPI0021D0990A|nr:uncharacterized protein LOC127138087 [Pisum sativum]